MDVPRRSIDAPEQEHILCAVDRYPPSFRRPPDANVSGALGCLTLNVSCHVRSLLDCGVADGSVGVINARWARSSCSCHASLYLCTIPPSRLEAGVAGGRRITPGVRITTKDAMEADDAYWWKNIRPLKGPLDL